jgi:hypothetical protein
MDSFSFKFWGIFLLVVLLSGTVGYISNDLYRDFRNYKDYSALWIPYNTTEEGALAISQSRDNVGSWICVNIKGATVEEALNSCKQEVGHEIFARACEKNITQCLGVYNG